MQFYTLCHQNPSNPNDKGDKQDETLLLSLWDAEVWSTVIQHQGHQTIESLINTQMKRHGTRLKNDGINLQERKEENVVTEKGKEEAAATQSSGDIKDSTLITEQ